MCLLNGDQITTIIVTGIICLTALLVFLTAMKD